MPGEAVSVLVVDDQAPFRMAARLVVRSTTGFEVVGEAKSGEEALDQVAALKPDLVLMDIQMPVIDGYEATRRIKAVPALKPTPVVAVSSFAMKGDEEKARAAGCDHYVTKPYSPMQLLKLVRGFLGDA